MNTININYFITNQKIEHPFRPVFLILSTAKSFEIFSKHTGHAFNSESFALN